MSNEWAFFIVVLPLFFLVYNVVMFFLILIHELSHAIPALYFTDKEVGIHIGYTGLDLDKTRKYFKLKRLKIHIKPKLFYSKVGGYCIYDSPSTTANQDLIIIIAGPVVTALMALILCFIFFALDAHGAIKLVSVIFCFVALISLVYNLYPRKLPTKDKDMLFYSDGYQILSLLKAKIKFKTYSEAIENYNSEDYSRASTLFIKLINQNFLQIDVYRLLITSLIKIEDYKNALVYDKQYFVLYASEATSDDYCNSGLIKSQLDMIEESLLDYNASLTLNPDNKYALSNKAYTNNLKKLYGDSITDLDKAISIDNDFAYAYANRGLAKIKTGRIEDGLNDINYSITLDKDEVYAYFNLGIYNFDRGNFTEALELFEKAKKLNRATHHIDNYITNTRKILQDS